MEFEKLIIKIEAEELKNLSLIETMRSGQHFRSRILKDGAVIVVNQYGLYLMKQDRQELCIYGEEPFDYRSYFDMDRDYGYIQQQLGLKDQHLLEAIQLNRGLRILKQDPFEMIMTFIISQSKQIPQIKILVERISSGYGRYLGTYMDEDYFAFPRPEELYGVDKTIYRALKMGYRSDYLEDAVHKVAMNIVDLKAIETMSYTSAKTSLMQIRGIGEKVANCVLLFGYGMFEAFPVDVWIERILGNLYFDTKPNKKEIETFINDYFDGYQGIAQQYLFEYARSEQFKEKK